MTRGEIWTVAGGAAHAGTPRPAVIVQDDRFDANDSIVVCPLTTDPTPAPIFRLPVRPSTQSGLRSPCRLMVDKVTAVPRKRLGILVGSLTSDEMRALNRALCVFLACPKPSGTQDSPQAAIRRQFSRRRADSNRAHKLNSNDDTAWQDVERLTDENAALRRALEVLRQEIEALRTSPGSRRQYARHWTSGVLLGASRVSILHLVLRDTVTMAGSASSWGWWARAGLDACPTVRDSARRSPRGDGTASACLSWANAR